MEAAERNRPDDLLASDGRGLFCSAGGFHIDPWKKVPLAIITHAHADHARPGCGKYIASQSCVPLLRSRLGADIDIRPLAYGEFLTLGRTRVSLHPAGHIRGAAQVRVEAASGEVWIAAGDYKRQSDASAEQFEVVKCDVFITEATFALPVYRFPDPVEVVREIREWWRSCAERGKPAVLFSYSLGKTQRVLAELQRLDQLPETPVLLHGAALELTELYREQGVAMLKTTPAPEHKRGKRLGPCLAIAPPAAAGGPWMRRFGSSTAFETGFASGWSRIRGMRRRANHDRGFVLSDHADWNDIIRTVRDTGARRVLCTHGSTVPLARYLKEKGWDAEVLNTKYEGESGADATPGSSEAGG
ncbi:MAG: ligase-associated DNA damage response exonuclease [Planctomycetota bacterium]